MTTEERVALQIGQLVLQNAVQATEIETLRARLAALAAQADAGTTEQKDD